MTERELEAIVIYRQFNVLQNMKKVFLIFWVIILNLSNFIYCQKLEFTHIKPIVGGYTVYFHVKDIKDDSHAKEILNDFLSDNNISWGRHFISIEGKHRYQLNINEFVTPEYIRKILNAHGTDFDFSTVSVDGVILNKSPLPNKNNSPESERIKVNAAGFPEYKSTGNKVEDDERYRIEKEKWIQENPEEYQKLLKEMELKNK